MYLEVGQAVEFQNFLTILWLICRLDSCGLDTMVRLTFAPSSFFKQENLPGVLCGRFFLRWTQETTGSRRSSQIPRRRSGPIWPGLVPSRCRVPGWPIHQGFWYSMVARLHMNHVILVIEVCSFVAGFFRCIQSNAQAHRTREEVCNQRTYTFFLGEAIRVSW